ncbi:MAG: AAA family ATPase [Polyangia bacterium]
MIHSIKIEKLRGIRKGELSDLSPLVVLLGPNGCGKSTILDALLIGAGNDTENALGRAIGRKRSAVVGGRWLVWKTGAEGSAGIVVGLSEPGGESNAIETTIKVRRATGKAHTLEFEKRVLDSSGAKVEETRNARRYGRAEEAYSGSVLERAVRHVRLVETWSGAGQPPLYQVFTEAAEQGRKQQAVGLVQKLMPGLETVEILTDTDDEPYLALTHPQGSIPADLAGDGVHALVRLAFDLATNPGGLALLEEPEVHQHPAAIRLTARTIAAAVQRGVQVVLSTHSLEMLDALRDLAGQEGLLDDLSLYRMRLEDGELSSSRLSGREVAMARDEIEEDLR